MVKLNHKKPLLGYNQNEFGLHQINGKTRLE